MMPEDLIRIRHMLDAIHEVLAFTANKTRTDLDNNRMLTLAIMKELEIIGEAVSKLSQECRLMHHHIPWTDIVGMRNRLVHGYFDVDLDMVWDTIQEDLVPLIDDLQRIIT